LGGPQWHDVHTKYRANLSKVLKFEMGHTVCWFYRPNFILWDNKIWKYR